MTSKTDGPRVLVTGGCGYLGSRLIRDLGAADFAAGKPRVRVFDNLQSGNPRALMSLPAQGRYEFVEGDVLDSSALRFALRGVDAVVHLAALVRTPMSFDHPAWVEQVNHWGTANLIDACLDTGVHRLIYVSTAAVYGPGGPFGEDDVCRPLGPYAQSKLKAEEALTAARKRGLQDTILRCGTLFGSAPLMRFDALVNRFAYLAGTERPLVVHGAGRQRRPVIHVDDASSAVVYCLRNPDSTQLQIFNLLTRCISVLELVDVVRAVRPSVSIRYTEQDVLTHLSFEASGQKLARHGWTPQIGVEQGLGRLLEDFRNISKFSPADAVS